MDQVERIIRRRAQMDVRLDIKAGELWGEEEIAYGAPEIQKKLEETFKIIGSERGAKLGGEITHHLVASEDILIWQEEYRIEKMLYILSRGDERVSDMESEELAGGF